MKKYFILILTIFIVSLSLVTTKAMSMGGYGNDFVRYYSVVTNDDDDTFDLYFNENDIVEFQSSTLSIQGNDYEIINLFDILSSMVIYWDVVGNKQVDYYINSGRNYTYFANFGGGDLILQSYDLIYISISRATMGDPYDIRIIGYNAGAGPFIIYDDVQSTAQMQFYFIDYGIYSHKIMDGTAGYMLGYNRGHSIGYNKGRTDFGIFYDSQWRTATYYGNIRYTAGLNASQQEAFDTGYQEGANDSFLGSLDTWIVPAIFIVIVVGGFFALRGRREN